MLAKGLITVSACVFVQLYDGLTSTVASRWWLQFVTVINEASTN